MVKTKRKKAKRKYKRKARGLTQREKEDLNKTLKKSYNPHTLFLSEKFNALPSDIIEQINSNVRMDNLHKKYFIDLIKEIVLIE